MSRVLFLGAAALLAVGVTCKPTVMQLNHLSNAAVNSGAICNDGSPAGYYYAPATTTAGASTWLVYLEGGLWCYNEASCRLRAQETPFFVSSVHWPLTQPLSGIFDDDIKRNPMAEAHKVYIGYCSSDAWSGDADPSPYTFDFAFKGQRIIEGTLSTIALQAGFGSLPHTRLLFGGCSAGARGAMFNLDYVAAMVPEGVSVMGFLDSSMWVDLDPISGNSAVPLVNETVAVLQLANSTGRLGPLCVEAYPDPHDQWHCLFGEFRMPFLTTPYLLSASQFDKYQLPYLEGAAPPFDAAELAYAAQFQSLVRGTMLDLPTANQPGSTVYSSACFKHCTSNINSFWGVRVAGVSLAETLRAWYNLEPTPPRIEACTGFGCGECHNDTIPHDPPLPPSHTADLTVINGISMSRAGPPPPAAPSPGWTSQTPPVPAMTAAQHQARHFGLIALLCAACAALCCAAEFALSARRNYTPLATAPSTRSSRPPKPPLARDVAGSAKALAAQWREARVSSASLNSNDPEAGSFEMTTSGYDAVDPAVFNPRAASPMTIAAHTSARAAARLGARPAGTKQ